MYLFKDLGYIDFREGWLQSLLWDKVDPVEALQNPDYTKLDMMKYFESLVATGSMFFWGSQEAGLVYRCYKPNEFTLEPHLVGSVKHLRTIQPIAQEFIFQHTPVLKVNIYTHLPTLKEIYLRYGFTLEGHVKNSVLSGGKLTDFYILGLSKEDYLNALPS